MRFSRSVRAGTGFLAVAAILTFTGVTAASAGTRSESAAFSALRGLSVPGTSHSVDAEAAASAFKSTNWSGYADLKSKFSKLSAKWTEPSLSCPSSATQLAAFWVGIDGFSSKTVEQDGTIGECYKGEAYYYTWWEMYPTNDIQVVGDTVSPGDKITSSVVKTGTSYTLSVKDATTPANSFTVKETCSASECVDSSAEWIAEAPSNSSGVLPLAHFSTWAASKAAVTGGTKTGTISSFKNDEITMVGSGGNTLASPSALNSAGNAFSVTWKATS
jgi:hypothetical protein